jgi:hypothetical protein
MIIFTFLSFAELLDCLRKKWETKITTAQKKKHKNRTVRIESVALVLFLVILWSKVKLISLADLNVNRSCYLSGRSFKRLL